MFPQGKMQNQRRLFSGRANKGRGRDTWRNQSGRRDLHQTPSVHREQAEASQQHPIVSTRLLAGSPKSWPTLVDWLDARRLISDMACRDTGWLKLSTTGQWKRFDKTKTQLAVDSALPFSLLSRSGWRQSWRLNTDFVNGWGCVLGWGRFDGHHNHSIPLCPMCKVLQ